MIFLLDKERSSGSAYRVNHIEYNYNQHDVSAIHISPDTKFKNGGYKRNNIHKRQMTQDSIRSSLARARKRIRESCLQVGANNLLTLTYRANENDLKKCWRDLSKFVRKVKVKYPNFCYVAVPEYQKRGAVHFHLAIRGYYHANTIRLIWLEVVGKGNGNIDFSSSKKMIALRNSTPRTLAGYISKYISKVDTVGFNKKRYSTGFITAPIRSHGWMHFALHMPVEYLLRKFLDELTGLPGQLTNSFHSSEGRFRYWSATTVHESEKKLNLGLSF